MYWQPIPLGWRDAPAVVALGRAIGSDDPRLHLLDLWEWAEQHGREHSMGLASALVESAAGWRGERGVLFDGLVSSGWVTVADDVATIVRWQGRITARHVDNRLSESMTKEEKAKAQAAIRAKKYRDRKAIESAANDEPTRDAASRPVTLRHAPSRVTRHARP